MLAFRKLPAQLRDRVARSQATAHADGPDAEDLAAKCTIYEHGIDTVLLLASRMSAHPNRSVRAYTDSIQRVLGPFAEPPLQRELAGELVLPGGVTVSQTIASFLRRWGDDLEGEDHWSDPDQGEAVLPASGSVDVEAVRAWRCTDWLVRIHTAAWLDLAALHDEASDLRAIDPIASTVDLKQATSALRRIAEQAERARARLVSAAVMRHRVDEPGQGAARLVQVARSAWAASAAGAAVEAGAAWCPQSSQATEAALWTWALRRSSELEDGGRWRRELQDHVDQLQRSALELVSEMLALSLPVVHSHDLEGSENR